MSPKGRNRICCSTRLCGRFPQHHASVSFICLAVPPAFAADFHSKLVGVAMKDMAVPPAFAADFHSLMSPKGRNRICCSTRLCGRFPQLKFTSDLSLFHPPLRQISTAHGLLFRHCYCCSTRLCGRFPQLYGALDYSSHELFHPPLRQISTAQTDQSRWALVLFHPPLRQISTAGSMGHTISTKLFHPPLRQISTAVGSGIP